jgi:hypothetical protein
MGRRTAPTTQSANRTNPVPRWVAPGFALAAVCTVPWVVFLAASLPATSRVNDRLAWVGFDVAEVVMLAVTAYLAWRGKAKVALAAMALATMLVVDAWFDVNTSTAGEERDMALGFAVLEVSLAAVSLWIAFHAASVARRRLEDLARREATREAAREMRRTLPSHGRPGRLTDLADWARERPGLLADAVARSGGDADAPDAHHINRTTELDQIRRSRSRKARDRLNSAARAPRIMRTASDARLSARKHIRRYVPDKRRPAAADAAD